MTNHPIPNDGAPDRIAKYEIRRLLGHGASGVVYLAYDPYVDREVAIKIAIQLMPKRTLEDSETNKSTFFAEARATGMLHHPGIVALYDAGYEGDMCYLVMEYVEGETLSHYCEPQGVRLSVAEVLGIGIHCAEALAHAHQRGVLHRDVKPGNIMLAPNKQPKLMDFSIAEILRLESRQGSKAVGSPLYMPPEQIMRQRLCPASDLYALGVVLYQLLVGTPPFQSHNLAGLFTLVRNQKASNVCDHRPDLPAELGRIIAVLLNKNPKQRYPDGDLLAADLRRVFNRLASHGERDESQSHFLILRKSELFAQLTDADLDRILFASELLTLPAGSAVLGETHTDSVCVILSGCLTWLKPDSSEMRLHTGHCFGITQQNITEASAMPRAYAAEPVTLLKIDLMHTEKLPLSTQSPLFKSLLQQVLRQLCG